MRHTFTHFHLRLKVMFARVADPTDDFRPRKDFSPKDLPTLMRKVWDATFASPRATIAFCAFFLYCKGHEMRNAMRPVAPTP